MKILGIKYDQPQFEFISYDLDGMNFFQRIWFLIKNPPRVRLVSNWNLYIFHADCEEPLMLHLPKGFETDFASIPRMCWILPGFSPLGPLRIGAIPHDFGYQHGYLLCIVDGKVAKTFVGEGQERFDSLMQQIVEKDNHAIVAPFVAYYILRLFGRIAWNKYRNHGPSAYNDNSLGIVGVDYSGNLRRHLD